MFSLEALGNLEWSGIYFEFVGIRVLIRQCENRLARNTTCILGHGGRRASREHRGGPSEVRKNGLYLLLIALRPGYPT